MRLWKNSKGDLITDEQLVRYVAFHGGLSQALAEGDVVLVAGGEDDPFVDERRRPKSRRGHAKLAARL